MFKNLYEILEKNTTNEEYLSMYDKLPEEIKKGYMKTDEGLIKDLKRAIIKINSRKNLSKEEKLFINSINCELIKFSKESDFTLEDILDCKKSLDYNRKYYESSFKKRFMPYSISEVERIINHNYNKIKLENRPLTKEEADSFLSYMFRSSKKYNQELNYSKLLFKDCITAITTYYLNEENLQDIKINWRTDIEDKNTLGQYGDCELDLNQNFIQGKISNDYNLIETLFHEMTHAIQDRKNNDNFMEEIIHGKDMAIFQNSKGVSKKVNYHLVSYEADARIKGVRKALAYIKEIAPECYFDYFGKMRKGLERDTKLLDINERLLFNEVTDVHEAFDHCRQDYREWAVLNYKMLSLEYNYDGTKKDLGEMIKDYQRHQDYLKSAITKEDIEEQKKYLKTYEMLFQARKSRTIQTIKDIKSVKKLIDNKTITNADIMTTLDFKNAFKRDTIFIKSKITSKIHPDKLNKMKIANTKKINNIYTKYYDEESKKNKTN